MTKKEIPSNAPMGPWFGTLAHSFSAPNLFNYTPCLRDIFPFYFEGVFACALFCVFGCKVAASAYLEAYLTQQLGYNPDTGAEFYSYEFLILLIWTAALIARIFGVMDQITVSAMYTRAATPPQASSPTTNLTTNHTPQVKPFTRVGPIINRAIISMILACFAVLVLDCNGESQLTRNLLGPLLCPGQPQKHLATHAKRHPTRSS